jgi:hypothetical protein
MANADVTSGTFYLFTWHLTLHYSNMKNIRLWKGAFVVVIVWYLDSQESMESVLITTKVVSSNPAHDEVYLIRYNIMWLKFVCDFGQISGYPPINLTATI